MARGGYPECLTKDPTMLLPTTGETWGLYDTVTDSWISEGDRIFLFHDVTIDKQVVPARINAKVARSLLKICSCEKCQERIIARRYDEAITGRFDIKAPALWRFLITPHLDHTEAK